MIELNVYDIEGKEIDKISVDKASFGSFIRYPLLKQAIVRYRANKRVGTAATKSRGMVAGSGRKLFKQKGTGNARVGNSRTGKRVGGGVTFAKVNRDFGKRMPKKQRRLATDSAILGKIIKGNVVIVDQLQFAEPKTQRFAAILSNLKIERSCLVASKESDSNLYKSARNLQRINVTSVYDLNAGDICAHAKLLCTKEAFMSLLNTKTNSN